ncbi:hypothetical protein GH5_02462 [Leishmania sp. Ghana 2012 LV757]|uniref:hypothetical protein n=1 Tax=Leishmania sp. Ghana 2012 LV757 TaxID=2803181 RepID=UPI001B4FFA8C|nr:hypothetical protein GH5_02462 [Leishmania sp. Ghana 2012 LV757]
MTSQVADVHDAGPLMEEMAPNQATTRPTETFVHFSSFRDAYSAWHEPVDFFQWLQSSDYAVTLLAASNLRPLRFTARERDITPAVSPSHDIEPPSVHLVLCAPCCNTTVVLSEEERLTLAKLERTFPFYGRSNGVATRKESSSAIPVHATELERQHGIIAGLLARAHQEGCAWRDRQDAGEKGGDAGEATVSCARQILLGSPSLCITESATVRGFCAALKLRSPGAEVTTNAAARVRCLLPRGTPPSVVRQWMEETLAVLDPASSAVDCGAATGTPRLRYLGSNVNDRILQLFFASKKRPRPEAVSGAAVGETGVSGEVVLQYMALLLSLYGYRVASASDVRSAEAENSGGEDAASGRGKTPAQTGSHRSSSLDAPPWKGARMIQSAADEEEGNRRTHRETVTQSTMMSNADTMMLLGWCMRCTFCAHCPAIVAVRESVTTTTTTTVPATRTIGSVRTPTGTTGLPAPDTSCDEAPMFLDEEVHALQPQRRMEAAVECSSGVGGNEDVLGALAEVEAALLSAACCRRGDQLEQDVHSREKDEGKAALSATPAFLADQSGAEGAHGSDDVCAGNEEGRDVGGDGVRPAKANSGDVRCGGAIPCDEQGTQVNSGVAFSQAEVTASPVTAVTETAAPASPSSLTTATTKSVTTRATRSVTTITFTFSRRPILQEENQQQLQQPRSCVSSAGHHDSCPWNRLFLTDTIDATALSAPERFMDFTWSVGGDDEAVGEESVTDRSRSASASLVAPGKQGTCDAHKAAGGANASGDELLVEPRDPSPSAGASGAGEESETFSHRTLLILRFLLPEVERLITTWRLSEEWERTRPSEYLRHPLWRTWLTSRTLHPVHTESVDGVMEQYLRSLERQLMPSQDTAEAPGMREKSPTAAAGGNNNGHSVSNQPAAGAMTNAMREALGSPEELCATMGAPLCNSSATSFSQTIETALQLATRSLQQCFARDPGTTKSGTAARPGDARRLLDEGLQLLLRASGTSTAQSVTVSNDAALKGAISTADNEDSRREEAAAVVHAFLRTVEARYADAVARECSSNTSRLRLALQREAIPRALHEITTSLYPTLEAHSAERITSTDDPAYVVHAALGSTNAAPSLTLSDQDRSRVMQYLQGMHHAAQEEQLQLAKEKAQEAQRLADAKAAAAASATATAAAAAKPFAPVVRAPATHNNAGKGRATQQQRSKGSRGPNLSPHQSSLQNQKQHQPVLQALPPSHRTSKVPVSHPARPSRVSAVFQADSRHSGGSAPQPLGYDNLPWASSPLFMHGGPGASPPPQPSPVLHPPHDAKVNSAQHLMAAPRNVQEGGIGPFNPSSSNSSLFPAPIAASGGGQEPFFLGSGLGGGARAEPGFVDDGGPLFSAMHPFSWSPFPPGPSGGDNANAVTAALYNHQLGAAQPRGRVSGPPPRGSDSVLGSLNASNLSSGSGGAVEDVRLSNWSSSSASQAPAHGGGSGGGVTSQSASPVLRRDCTEGGNRYVGGTSAPSVLGTAAPSSFTTPKPSPSATQPPSASRGVVTNRTRGNRQNLQLPAPHSQSSPRGKAGSPALVGGGSNVHAPAARSGGGGGVGRSGQGRGRGGGGGSGQRRGGVGRGGGGAGSGFRRGG